MTKEPYDESSAFDERQPNIDDSVILARYLQSTKEEWKRYDMIYKYHLNRGEPSIIEYEIRNLIIDWKETMY